MKKYIISASLVLASGTFIVSSTQSCIAMATSGIGIAIIKQVLLGGITKGLSTFKDKDSFLASNLIDQALPKELKEINKVLEKIAPNLVTKEKDYIAQAAAFTVNVSEPILVNAVNSLTAEDITRVANGQAGTATQLLKEKTSQQLVAAILPKVDEKLNEFGIVKTLNTALKGNNILGALLGNQNGSNLASGGLSQLASEQMVNGLFNIIENHEKQNQGKILKAFGK